MIMKNLFLHLTIGLLLTIAVFGACCTSNNPDPTYPTYSFVDPIVNPPDTFQIVYNISTNGDKFAYVTFKDNAVWYIEKLGDSRINYWANNDTGSLGIVTSDTLGLEAGFTYIFAANNNNYGEFNNFFTQFNKTTFDYDTFEPKF